MDKILKEDLASFRLPYELTECLRGATIIVTGATGLIGSMFVRCLRALELDIRWLLPVRDLRKAEELLLGNGNDSHVGDIVLIEGNITEFFAHAQHDADYIIHCASPTNGEFMSRHPAETFLLAVESTKAALDYCRRKPVKGMVYVSSLEYYGQRYDDDPITEVMTGQIDHQSPRSSYPLGKQAAEYLCFSYAAEYGLPVSIARLTQTFGAGVAPGDKRVFAQFARSVIAGNDIVLHTCGKSAKPYCYTTDCVAALAYILLKGKPGDAYNVATPGTYVSIRRLAEIFREMFNQEIEIRVCPEDAGYAPETRLNLNSDKLQALGWRPLHDLEDMLRRLVESMQNDKK
ncbi:MAG: NAD(P)-dependent oxidoreductase [Paramuribaculum sp.]|nr:NAD(P)-dependent oxidoreductase [Paramuribaculum sp.]